MPFRCRLEFIEALAALSAVFSEDMSRRVTGANQSVAHILWCAAEPDRCEWFFNNIRYRHTLSSGLSCSLIGPRDHVSFSKTCTPAAFLVAGRKILAFLPSGTASNEALHAEVKSWFLQTQQMHQGTLCLKLSILGLAKVLPHVSAVHHPTISQLSSQLLLARITARSVWSDAVWEDWCMSCVDNDRRQKAFLPNYTSRTADVEKVCVRRLWAVPLRGSTCPG